MVIYLGSARRRVAICRHRLGTLPYTHSPLSGLKRGRGEVYFGKRFRSVRPLLTLTPFPTNFAIPIDPNLDFNSGINIPADPNLNSVRKD
jgi:hypothetical protein